jgi:epoxyqueuosine reductase QueG
MSLLEHAIDMQRALVDDAEKKIEQFLSLKPKVPVEPISEKATVYNLWLDTMKQLRDYHKREKQRLTLMTFTVRKTE